MTQHRKWMQYALDLAEKGRGFVSPNPVVGAVLVRDGQVIAEDWHRKFGEGHAERNLLEGFDGDIRTDDVLYVTLEPCCHQGKTPACTDIILERGVRNVVVGLWDPYDKMNKKSVQFLRDQGLNVEVLEELELDSDLVQQLKWQNRFFLKWIQSGLPWITLKLAQTLDGRITPDRGQQYWLTGEETSHHVHQQRAMYDAILVGAKTVIADNPQLTVRLEGYEGQQPRAVVLDAALSVPFDAHLMRAGTLIFKGTAIKKRQGRELGVVERGAEVVEVNSDVDGYLDLLQVLQELGQRGMSSLMVEGGPSIWSSFWKQNLVDEVLLYMAPKFLGSGVSTFEGMQGLESRPLHLKASEQLGDDLMFDWSLR